MINNLITQRILNYCRRPTLQDFIKHEFSGQTISPLGIINDLLEKRLIKWDKKLQMIIEDWQTCNESPQPKKEVKRFEKNTGYKYAGPK